MDEVARFHWADYLVLILSIVISAGIGVFYGIKDRKNQTNENFLMGGRNLSIFPVAASTFSTLASSIGFVADPVEVYYFGMGYMLMIMGMGFGIIPICEVFIPAFHKMNLVSAFEYIGETYNGFVRTACSLIQILLMLVFMAIILYVPAIALSLVSPVPTWLGILLTTIVCNFYTTFGGMKAVVWANTIQTIIMILGIFIVAFKAIHDVGGFSTMGEILRENGRVNDFELTLNPFVRSSLWAYIFGGFFRLLIPLSSTQMTIQRYCTLPTARDAKIATYLMYPMYVMLATAFFLTGSAMYAMWIKCDPMVSGRVKTVDQMVPLMVMETFAGAPGFPGMFVACLFAAALSSLSAGQNSLAASLLKDLVEPAYEKKYNQPMTEQMAFRVAKGLAFLVGFVIMFVAFGVNASGGNIFMLFNKVFGMFAGPLGGIFFLAILCKSVDVVGAAAGFLTGVVLCGWIGIGSMFYDFRPNILPIGIKGCFEIPDFNSTINGTEPVNPFAHLYVNGTLTLPRPTPDPTGFAVIYNLNPLYYGVLGYLSTIGMALLVSKIRKMRGKGRSDSIDSDDSSKKINTSTQEVTYAPNWSKETSNRLSMAPLSLKVSKADSGTQTYQSIPPDYKQDLLWVLSQESVM